MRSLCPITLHTALVFVTEKETVGGHCDLNPNTRSVFQVSVLPLSLLEERKRYASITCKDRFRTLT